MTASKRRISFGSRQRLILQKAMRADSRRVGAEDVPIEVELPDAREDGITRVNDLRADDAGSESLADDGGVIVEAEGLVPKSIEMGAAGQENVHVDGSGGGEGGIGLSTEGIEKGRIMQEVREDPEGDFMGVVVYAGTGQQGHGV